tara:strand:- start:1601 stop:1999 length:399 start_codon:yes stop_codon:yes gene_type:complete
MALPTSGPLSMSAIATEFSQASSNMSLYTFGSTLPTPTVTSNIELANDFYGQSASSCTSFTSTSISSKEPCAGEPEDTLYHNGSGIYPVVGDNVFTDSSCGEPLSEGSYLMASSKVMVIEGESGEVTSVYSC